MMSIAIMQPYFFPYLGYFQLIREVDTFILYDSLDYIKYGWVNRNRLLPVNGSPFYIVVPLKRKSSNTKIEATQIAGGPWRRKILGSIYHCYRRAPFFDEVFPILESVIEHETDSLSALNTEGITKIADYLGITTEIVANFDSESLEKRLATWSDKPLDVFPDIHLETPSVKVIRVIELCRAFGAVTFINPIGGRELYSREDFQRNGIRLHFLRMKDVRYPQTSNDYRHSGRFHPSLSVIDVLMNCGKEGTGDLLSEFDLV